jgi:uncharacterized protein (TIGR00162 family)
MFLYVDCAKAYSLYHLRRCAHMDKPVFNVLSQPKLENTVLVEGLPGFGNIGKIAASMLIEFTHANLFAELYSPSFPDYVTVSKNGVCQPPKYEFYTAPLGKTHFVILTGDAQPSREDVVAHYTLCDEILNLMEQYGCKFIATMAGVTTPKPAGEVYVATTSTDLGAKAVEKGAIIYGGGRIVGAAGLLLGLAKNRGWEGICLLGTTTGLKADREAAYSVFKLLLKMFGIENSLKSTSEEKR